MFALLRPLFAVFGILTLVCGLVYPLFVTGLAQAFFPRAANGSLVERDGKAVGSSLIGQPFSAPGYFWGRPSATAPMPANGLASSGSNQGPLNPALIDAVKERIAALRAADPGHAGAIPADLVSASASGLDPEISLAAARYQAPRIARERKLPLARIEGMIQRQQEAPLPSFLGEARVNVLALNLELDRMAAK